MTDRLETIIRTDTFGTADGEEGLAWIAADVARQHAMKLIGKLPLNLVNQLAKVVTSHQYSL